jgi:CubicO group peptidase (beta-lactamase class C family)
MKTWIAALATTALAALVAVEAVAQQPAAAPKALQELRLNMFEPEVYTLTNRTVELVFDTAAVEAGDDVWTLPDDLRALDFTYDFNGETLEAAAFAEANYTDALLILKSGRVVHEDYLNRTDRATRFLSSSMAKSLNAVLVGLAIEDGHISSVEDQVTTYVPELAGTGYDGVTVRNLLEMRSGVDWVDNFFAPGPARDAHVAAFVENSARYTDWAGSAVRAHAPGEAFNYNSLDAALAGLVVERAVGRTLSAYMTERLWRPAGMEADGFYVLDGPPGVGREFTAGAFNATLRDYARIGQLMLDGGEANGRQVLPSAWVSQSTAPSTTAEGETGVPGLGYAYFWWTVLGSDAFMALGGGGQFIYIDPATETVIVKLSHVPVGPNGDRDATARALAFFEAASRWTPN